MNRTSTKISVDKYLPIKRIVILSLVVTMAYYFLFTLNHYFARPSFDNRETESTLDEDDAKAKTVEYNDARDRSNERRREYFASPEEARRNFYKKVLLNIPLTFIMVFAVILFCKFIYARDFKRRLDEVMLIILGTLVITFALSTLCTLLQLEVFPDRPGPPRTPFQYVMRGYLGDCSLMAMAIIAVYLIRAQYR